MQKSATMLAVVGGLMATGIALSFYGSMVITEDLSQSTGNIGNGDLLEVEAQLDPDVNNAAVYVVQIMEFKEGEISAQVIDPFGSQIVFETIRSESFEDQFEITSSGIYKLIIQNSGENTDVIGVIGHVPDTHKFSIGITGFYLLIVGLVGMGVVGIYVVKNRRRD